MESAPRRPSRLAALRPYRRLKGLAAGILGLQLTLGLAGVLTPGREIFPFASWFLFSLVPDRVVSYDLLLRGSEQRPIPPRPFSEAGGLVKSPHAVTAYQLIQQLGRAIDAHQPDEIRARRRDIERQFATAGMRYDVVRVSYRLADRWKNRQAPETVHLGVYSAGTLEGASQ